MGDHGRHRGHRDGIRAGNRCGLERVGRVDPHQGHTVTRPRLLAVLSGLTFLSACGEGTGLDQPIVSGEEQCTIDPALLLDAGVGRNGIPSLQNPTFVSPDHEDAQYLRPDDRVIGVTLGDRVLAVPHNILWWHEILNIDVPEGQFAITYCPLTGTALAFDRQPVSGAELGVSGLLFMNNLVMFDRSSTLETLFPQIMGEGVCGLRKREALPRLAVSEMRWDAWLERHPDTEVVSDETGFSRDYQVYPYGSYEDLSEPPLMPQTFDRSRPPKERLMGVEGPEGSFVAYPFIELQELGKRAVLNVTIDGAPLAIVWDAEAESAVVFSRIPVSPIGEVDQPVTLAFEGDQMVDLETGDEWSLTGGALSGRLQGFHLELHPRAMVAFWFAWISFHPDTGIWVAP